MVNLVGLLRRAAPGLYAGTARGIGWGAYALGLVAVCVGWARSRAIREVPAGLAVLLGIFVTPHLHYHDLALLLVPLIAFILVAVREGYLAERTVVLLPLALSLLLLISSSLAVIKLNLPYLVMGGLAFALWIPGKIFKRLPRKLNEVP